MMEFLDVINKLDLSSDTIVLIISFVVMFKYFKEIVFHLVDRFEESLKGIYAEMKHDREKLEDVFRESHGECKNELRDMTRRCTDKGGS